MNTYGGVVMKEIKAIIQPFMLEKVILALEELEHVPGLTISHVLGWGKTRALHAHDQVNIGEHRFAKKVKLEIVVPDELCDTIVRTIEQSAHTGNPGDGKIFVYDITDVVKIRTGERGPSAI